MPDGRVQALPFGDLIAAAESRPASGAGWLSDLRARAGQRYARAGWPHARTESWKYTSLNVLAAETFVLEPRCDAAIPEGHILALDAPRIVLINGILHPRLSDLDHLPAGVTLHRLSDCGDWVHDIAAELIEETVSSDRLPLAALNSAMFQDAVLLDISNGAMADRPVHVISVGAGANAGYAPRIMIRAGRDSAADIVESHVGTGTSMYFANAVTQVSVGSGAVVGHYKFQNEMLDAFHIAMTAVELAEGAVYDNFVLSMGARLARNEIRGRISGARAEYRVNGAYLGTARQHLDNTTFIDHAAAGSRSREVYKGVLDGSSRGVFQGKILVRPDSQQTDGYQMNRAMLLSDRAEIDSKPELEIYADDVRCSHGATVGSLQEDQVFYLQARGIPRDLARRLLLAAYLDDAIDEARSETVREAMKRAVAGWLAGTDAGGGT